MRRSGERVEVQVECLEFEGLEVREPARVQSAFMAELTRLVVERGVPEASEGRAAGVELDGGSLQPVDLSSPERLGWAVARQVYVGLSAPGDASFGRESS